MTQKQEKIEPVVEEIRLADMALAALNESEDVAQAVKVLKEHVERKKRLEQEFKEFEEKKVGLEVKIADLDKNFGEVDAAEDLQKLEDFEIKLKAVTKAIPLVRRRLEHESSLSKDIEDYKQELGHSIHVALHDVGELWQEDIDRRVDELLECLATYPKAVGRIMAEQTVVDRKYLALSAIRSIRPEIKDIDAFDKYSRFGSSMMMIPVSAEVTPRNIIVNRVEAGGNGGVSGLPASIPTPFG